MTPAHPTFTDATRRRLFIGICLALIPTGASFALVSNILVPLKQEFILTNYQVGLIGGAALWGMALSLLIMGPLLESFGLRNGARMAFVGHLTGITLMIVAAGRTGDPSAFPLLMAGAAILAAGNGMIEVTGNPLVAALYPNEKTKHLNWFHAFFPIGIVLGGIAGFLMSTYGGSFGRWPYQIGIIYIPILIYGAMVLPKQFPRTENAEAGIPVGEMFRYTLTNPFFLMMLALMALTTSLELGPMRWIPAMLQANGLHGILVLVWISGWMVVLRALSGHFVERFAPTGMLLLAATLTGAGLFLLSYADGTWTAFAAATVFAWGVAFFFPTMVGVVSEKMPRTGSLGIVLTAGVGLGMAGAIGVPTMGKLADNYLAESLPVEATALLQRVDAKFPEYITRAQQTTDLATLGYRQSEVEGALQATKTALAAGSVHNDATANALRAIVGTAIPNEPLIGEANGLLQPAEALGGKKSFRYVAPLALILIAVFGAMYARDRSKGGYRAVSIQKAAALLFGALALSIASAATMQAQTRPTAANTRTMIVPKIDRLRVMFLGDNGHHRPTQRAAQILPALSRNGVDMFYTDNPADLDSANLANYQTVILYNNHMTVTRPQLNALMQFVSKGGGLVVLHCASASFQNSEEFISLVGAAFKSHGTGTFAATRTNTTHPIVRDVPTWQSWDETYIHTKHNPINRTVLEVRSENGHNEPWTWVRTHGNGRVFYTAWGHDQRTWGMEGFLQMIGQAVKWTAGDWAMSIVSRDPQIKMMDLEVPLPTYKRPPAPWNVLDTAIMKAQAALPTEASLKMMTMPPGFRVESFAVEPMIGNIIDFTWDARGRMWAVETQDYPNTVLPDSVPGNDRILIIDDANGDGRADKVTVFATGMNLATSLAFANGGVVVGQAPHMLFFKDTNGDDKADEKKILFTGWPRTDTHGAISNLRYGFDNQVWGSVGYNGFRGTVGGVTYERGQMGAGYFRFPGDGSNLDYIARTSNNTWGVGLTEDGYVFGSTANSRPTQFVHIPGRYYRGIGLRDTILPDIADRIDLFPQIDILQVDQFGRYTAGAAHEIYTARAFPSSYWNRTAFVAEPTAHLIGMFDLSDNGSGFRAKNRWNFMSSRDAWAAPVQVKVGPDGAIWVSDFYTLVAQHNPTPQNMKGCCQTGRGAAYETPNRDKLHGRIYRIAYGAAPARTSTTPRMRLDNATPAQLVRALTNDNMFWRMTAQRLLVERKTLDVVPALVQLASSQEVDALGMNVGALHALWTLHGLGALNATGGNAEALRVARNGLRHPAAAIRRAALQMLPRSATLEGDVFDAGLLPDRKSPWTVEYTVPTPLLQDADAHVRLEALLVLSELPASARSAAALADVISSPENARDPWIPEAVAMAGVKQGPSFVNTMAALRVPGNDSIATRGMRRAMQKIVRVHAMTADAGTVVPMITLVPKAPPALAVALLDGIAQGWPEEKPPMLTAEQKAALVAAAKDAPADVAAAFARVATRWTLPDVFKTP